jgi:O-antigen/teichoic acid export membrane protein
LDRTVLGVALLASLYETLFATLGVAFMVREGCYTESASWPPQAICPGLYFSSAALTARQTPSRAGRSTPTATAAAQRRCTFLLALGRAALVVESAGLRPRPPPPRI